MSQESALSVLLIEDEPDAAKLVQYVLSKPGGVPLAVDWASDLRSGLERLSQREYQAVLLDLNLPDSSGFDTFARVRQQSADRAVIVLTAHEDEALALQAVRSGADEYLIKSDIRDRFLAQRIRYAVERNRLRRQSPEKPVRAGRILSLIGSKGGAGTTTVVLNLAAALAKMGKSVVALELASQYGSFAAHLNHVPAWDAATLLKTSAEVMTRDALESCLTPLEGGFRALFGPQRFEDYRAVSPEHARALLRTAAMVADFTLVDVPSTFGPATLEIVQHSGFTAVVVERDWLGLDAARAKAPLLRPAAARAGSVGVVLCSKTHLECMPLAEFSRRLGYGIVGLLPPAGDMLAANHSELPLAVSRPGTPFAESVVEMARRFNADPVRFVPV
ncbi:MAG TPA: response regulator [Bryobacteraceae bacterium]|nr:response regulator [Bryobacteraceae bacterium]